MKKNKGLHDFLCLFYSYLVYDEDYQWDEVEENDYDGTDADHKVREILKRMDKDKNQKISHEELLIWVFRAFHSVDVVDIAEEDFDEMDVNDDKKISWHEYIVFNTMKIDD